MKKPELLAPVGSMESLIAAVQAGCDAVYLSGKKYGARVFATNFSDDELVSAVNYARPYGVKIYVTVNTIIYESEVSDFLLYIDYLHKIGVDAVIMQDIGMIDLVRKVYPNLEIHASTQINIHNIEGVKFIEKLGIKRVVLARETSVDTIRNIKMNSDIELEVFVHGALCISYSGQCLMSSLIGGRSGNRGACAGCCRLPFDLISDGNRVNSDKYLLSTRDLMTLNNIGELIDIGVDSFKIEGRMKRPEYVYLVVSLYRMAIDSYMADGVLNITFDDIKELKKIFNRGFTKGYLFNEKFIVNQSRPNHMGIEIGKVVSYKNGYAFIKLSDELCLQDGIRIISKNDIGMTVTKMFKDNRSICSALSGIICIKCDPVNVGDIVLKTTDYNQLKNINDKISANTRKVKINGKVKLLKNQHSYIEISDGENMVSVTGDVVELAISNSTSVSDIKKQINRLGNTIYEFVNLDVIADDGIFVRVSQLNDLRRRVIHLLDEKRLYKIDYKKCDYTISVPNFDRVSGYCCLISNVSEYNNLDRDKFDYIYTDDYDLFCGLPGVFYKVPRVNNSYVFASSRVLVGDIGGLFKYSDVDTDFSFNVVNSYAVAFLHSIGVNKVTLSYELDLINTKNIIEGYHRRYNAHPNLEVIGSSYEEVMVSKFNLLDYYGVNNGKLRDKFGNLYNIKEKNGLMYIYNYKKRVINFSDYFNIGINYIRINM